MTRVALVTASTEGIGFAIARKLAQSGAHVIVSSRKQKNVDKAVNALQKENLKVTGIVCHVAKSEDRKNLLDHIDKTFGGLDILVSNAAVNPYFGSILATPESAYDKMFEVNVKATFLLIKEAVPLIQKRKHGAIVIVSSTAGYSPSELLGIYSVTKTALIGMTKALVPELSKSNIRINCLAPGIIRTKFSEVLLEGGENTVMQQMGVQRVGVPEDCAGIVDFLCSDAASYINGQTVVVAGEMQCRL